MAAEQLGAEVVLDPSAEPVTPQILELTDGIGADVIIAATNEPSVVPEMFKMLRRGGCANVFGLFPHGTRIDLDVEEFHYSGHKVLASWALTRKDTVEARNEIAERWLALELILTGLFSLDQPMEAFNYVVQRTGLKAAFAP